MSLLLKSVTNSRSIASSIRLVLNLNKKKSNQILLTPLVSCHYILDRNNLSTNMMNNNDPNNMRDDNNNNNNNKKIKEMEYEYYENKMEYLSPNLKRYLAEEKKYDGKLVYVGQLTRQLKSAKILSLSSSLFGIMLMPFLTDSLSSSSIFAQFFVFGTTGFFIFVTPLFSQFLGRRYVSRLYYNYEEKKFKAILFSFLMYEYKLEFSLNDLIVPDLPGPFTTVKVKNTNRSLFIDLNQINDLELTHKIYGYDKPFDIKKFTEEKQKQQKQEDDD